MLTVALNFSNFQSDEIQSRNRAEEFPDLIYGRYVAYQGFVRISLGHVVLRITDVVFYHLIMEEWKEI